MLETENIDEVDCTKHFVENNDILLKIWFSPNLKDEDADLRKIPRFETINF